MSNLLAIGSQAPDFSLRDPMGQITRLSDYRGKSVVLVFYPADWSPVCGDQLGLYNQAFNKIEALDAKLIGIAVDSHWCHAAYISARKLQFPLLADFEPKGEVSKQYKAYDENAGTSARAIYVIDGEGAIQWEYLSPLDVNPGMNGFLKALRTLKGECTDPIETLEDSDLDHIYGASTAAITLLEYGDYECPHCRVAHGEIKKILKHFGLNIRFVFKNFPLSQIHPHAELAAEAAESAAGLGQFWGMHDFLFEHQDDLQLEKLLQYARILGIDDRQLQRDLETRCYLPRVKADFESGIEKGVNGTPSFFINGIRHDGSHDAETLIAVIQKKIDEMAFTHIVQ
jgi:peroxiredoxin/protein-disulfide isomerase